MLFHGRSLTTRVVLWSFCAVALIVPLVLASGFWPDTLHGQTDLSSPEGLSKEMRAKLEQRGSIMLRDATLVEAMFIIEEQWEVNIVISNEAKEAVNGSYKDAPLHEILDTLLSSQGYGYRVVGDSLVVMKLEQIGTKRPLFETVRIPLENIPPDEVVELIKILLSPDGAAHAVPTAKSIVVMDYPERIDQVRTRIRELDEAAAIAIREREDEEARAAEAARQQAARQRTAAQVVDASRIGANVDTPDANSAGNDQSSEISEVIEPNADSESEEGHSDGENSSIPDPRTTNDGQSSTGNNGTSSRSASQNATVQSATSQLQPNALPSLDNSSSFGPTTSLAGPAEDGSSGAVPDLEIAFFAPQYVEASAIVDSLATMVSEYGQVTAIAEENRIVAIDQPAYLKRLSFAVKQLDMARPQVRISAIIFDASLEDLENVGLNITHTARGNNMDSSGNAQDQFTIGTMLAPTPGAAALNGGITAMSLSRHFDITGVVNLLRTSNRSKLLADPTVVVMHRESARIEIVTEIPYQQLTESAQGGSIGTTAFREAGVTLEVSPHVSDDGTVRFVVTPQFSVLTGFTEEENQPIIARRAAQTVVTVADQQTLVIGGLRQRSKVRNRAAVPYLADMKFIGHLFRQRGDEIRESELLVFLTPTIISPQHFGTCREQRVFEQGKCELEKIAEEYCERCKPPEDPTIYTNHDYSYGAVHVNVGPASESQDEALREDVLPQSDSSDAPATRLPAARRSESPADNQQQLLPPLTTPQPQTSTRRSASGNMVQHHSTVVPALEVQQAQRATVHPARSQPVRDPQAARPARTQQRVARHTSEIPRYTKLPPIDDVPAGRPPAGFQRHEAPGGMSRAIQKLNVIKDNSSSDGGMFDVPSAQEPAIVEGDELGGFIQL